MGIATLTHALPYITTILSNWLPDGQVQGKEYVALNPKRNDQQIGSFKINIESGCWADFAINKHGKDLLSLGSYLFDENLNQSELRIQDFLRENSLNEKPHIISDSNVGSLITPVPEDALDLPIPYSNLGKPTFVWEYKNYQGEILFRMCRFITAEGCKEDRPLTYRNVNGIESWVWKGYDKPRPLYGLDRLAQNPNAPVLICEGEKATDAAQIIFPEYVAMTSSHGANSALQTDWSALKDRRITIWPDNDPTGYNYAKTVRKILNEAGSQHVQIVAVPKIFPDKWDLADAFPDGWDREKIFQVLISCHEEETPNYVPDGYVIIKNKLCKYDPKKDKAVEICSPLLIPTLIRDRTSNNWGKLLVWHDQDHQKHEEIISAELLATNGPELKKLLLSGGLNVRSGMLNDVFDYIFSANPQKRAILVPMVGWDLDTYILPNGVPIGKPSEQVYLQLQGSKPQMLEKGNIISWIQNVAQYAENNSRLMFAISTAFAGPLLKMLNEPSGGFHFHGESSTGKTTALKMASSVWGIVIGFSPFLRFKF